MKSAHTIYNLKWLFILVPVVGLLISAIFFKSVEKLSGTQSLFTILHAIFITSGLWAGCMFIVDILWRKYPWEYFPFKHLIYEIILLLLFTNLFSLAIYTFEVKFGLTKEIENLYFEIVVTNLITFFITALHEAAFFYKQWKLHFSKSVKLEKDNIEAKYETLKAQVNPHFLFNSLNSLTSIVEDNQHAVNYIQNLSEFLRYVLKSRDKELVPLSDELEILNKYVSLQKSRFNKNLNVIIDINKDLGHFALPPLVLQMLVENCIKHNIISGEKPLFITIEAYSGWIHVENNLQKKNPAESTGNGLRNIVERYRFFTKNDVKILETDSTFKVSVPLLHFKI